MFASSSTEDASSLRVERTSSGPTAGHWLGIHIQLDWSLLIVFGLVIANLGGAVFPSWHPEWSQTTAWAVATAAAALFVVSVLLHELSHALVARAVGIPVRRVTLFLFGGTTEMEREPSSPRSDFLTAIVGPLTSLVIGVLATSVGVALAGDALTDARSDPAALRGALHHIGPAATLLLWLGPINVMLALFNVLPGFPLDGGRVLRSLLWWVTGDMLKATRWVSIVGQGFGWLLLAFGVMSMFSGIVGQGLWLLLIGWFLNTAARRSYARLSMRHLLHGVPVSRVMWTQPGRVPPDLTIDEFVHDHLLASDQSVFAVEADGALLGLVVLDDVRQVPQAYWRETRIADIMTPRAELTTLPPSSDAERALEELGRHDVNQIPIVDGTHLQGLVRRRDLVRWLVHRGEASPA